MVASNRAQCQCHLVWMRALERAGVVDGWLCFFWKYLRISCVPLGSMAWMCWCWDNDIKLTESSLPAANMGTFHQPNCSGWPWRFSPAWHKADKQFLRVRQTLTLGSIMPRELSLPSPISFPPFSFPAIYYPGISFPVISFPPLSFPSHPFQQPTTGHTALSSHHYVCLWQLLI